MNGDDDMAYGVKPSIGMLPINDIDKVMAEQGFMKKINPGHIQEATQVKDSNGNITTAGIADPTMIAICAGERFDNGELDRETVKNAMNLGGKPASDYLESKDKDIIESLINQLKNTNSNEIQLLRDELYQLKAELVKTGHAADTLVMNGFIDGFKNSNKKFSQLSTQITAIDNTFLEQDNPIFSEKDWLVVRKNIADNQSNSLAAVTKEQGSKIQLDTGSANINIDNSVLYKSLGEYNRGTYSFSEIAEGTPGTKEYYTMLNDDSSVSKQKIDSNFTGLATVIKIPTRNAGFLTKFIVYGKKVGNPGALTCHLIKGSSEYITGTLAATNGLSQAKKDGTLIASSSPTVLSTDNEITFDFTNTNYSVGDHASTLYPEVAGTEYCFVVEADNVSAYDYWELELGHKKNSQADLQTNNTTYNFYNKDLLTTGNKSFVEIPEADLLYMAVTKTKKDEDEIPYDIGLYTSAEPIKLAHPIASTRARLTLEINKEGNFISKTVGTVKANADTIEFSNLDGSHPSQTIIGGGDKVIIGGTIANVVTSTPDTLVIDKSMYVNPNDSIYRCGYKIKLKTYLVEKDPVTLAEVINEESIKYHDMNLVAVIPSGRGKASSISDRLIFEIDMENAKDQAGNVMEFNQAELQIKWNSALNSTIIRTQAEAGNDYVGRIHGLSLAFDKII